jgi:hypothetical protein
MDYLDGYPFLDALPSHFLWKKSPKIREPLIAAGDRTGRHFCAAQDARVKDPGI